MLRTAGRGRPVLHTKCCRAAVSLDVKEFWASLPAMSSLMKAVKVGELRVGVGVLPMAARGAPEVA